MTRLFRTGRTVAFLWAFVFLVAAVPPSSAQDLRLHLSADSVTVGERFFLSITTEHDFAADPQFPEPTDSLVFGDIEVLTRTSRNRYSRGDMRIDSVVYEVTTFALDTAVVSPIPVLFAAGEDTFSVRTSEQFIHVISLVPPETQEVRDLAPLVDFPRPIWPYVAAAAALLLLAALLALYLVRRRRRIPAEAAAPPAPADPADVEARKRLKALENTDLTRSETVQPYYTELSDTLRTYLARRLHVHSMETTTRELLRELSQHGVPRADTRRHLQDVLLLADYVKFADATPPPDRGVEALGTAREIIESVEEELRPRESTAPAAAG